MSQYVDYQYYIGPYAGTAVTSTDFTQLAVRASAQIDALTFNRAGPVITDGTDLVSIDAIKMATCAVVDALQAAGLSGSDSGITSESVGGHSVSYAEKSLATRSLYERLKAAAAIYLAPTRLMFPGFAEGEYSSDRTGRRVTP